jgi:hypothetical protein
MALPGECHPACQSVALGIVADFFYAGLRHFHAGLGFFHAGLGFFHAGLGFFHAGLGFFYAEPREK